MLDYTTPLFDAVSTPIMVVRDSRLYTDLDSLAVVYTRHRATTSTNPLYTYKQNVYAHASFTVDTDTNHFHRIQHTLLSYPLNDWDVQYIYNARMYETTHPRQRLCSFADLENTDRPAVGSFWLNPRYAVKILHSGLFTARVEIIDIESQRKYEDTLSHWLLRMEYDHDPNAETEFYVYALSDH